MKKALITGITGQDGSFLAELLIDKGYEVHGIVRRASISNTGRIDHLLAEHKVTLHDGDLSDSSSLIRIINIVQPDEIYNLAAQSHVQVSFDVPEYSRGCGCAWRAPHSGGREDLRVGKENQDLSGIYLRAVWKSGGGSSKRDHTFPSLQPLCSCQAVRLLDHKGIQGSIRNVCCERHSF